MRALLALFLVACASEGGNYPPGSAPILPGSGGTTVRPDARPASGGDAGVGIAGEVCLITDVRTRAPCTPLTGTSLTVRVNETGAVAQVGSDGRFSLPAVGGMAQVTLITSTDDRVYFGSAVPVNVGSAGTAVVDIPVMRQADVADLAAANGASLAPGAGVLVVHTASGATLDPIGGAVPLYDTSVAGQFTIQPPTGPDGVALFFDVAGAVSTTIHTAATSRTLNATVVANTLTFVDLPI